MTANRQQMTGMLRTLAMVAIILLPKTAIAADPSVNCQLLSAAEKGSLEQVKALLAKGADVNAKD